MNTHKTILLVILIVISKNNIAQYITPGSYEINNTLSRFEGSWLWNNGTDTVWLNMQKQKVHFSDVPFDQDVLVGWHKYKKGNTIIESNYTNIGIQYTPSTRLNSSIFGSNAPATDSNLFEGTINDISKNKAISLTLTLNSAQNQLIWKTENIPGTTYGNFDYSFTLPTLMTFIKQ
jgi:hypothetical protein